jgi:hypothetical protein
MSVAARLAPANRTRSRPASAFSFGTSVAASRATRAGPHSVRDSVLEKTTLGMELRWRAKATRRSGLVNPPALSGASEVSAVGQNCDRSW